MKIKYTPFKPMGEKSPYDFKTVAYLVIIKIRLRKMAGYFF